MLKPDITAFFDPATSTYSYVVRDPSSRACAIVDPVLDYDPAAGRTSHASAERLIAHVRQHDLQVEWLLETHVHADHLSAAIFLQRELGGCLAIGARITQVQAKFSGLFNLGEAFPVDGRQFEHLFEDGESFRIGALECRALHTPGHTPACITYLVGDHAFFGSSRFMPDSGTAR
ncbi:MBL fold metallo-hydrolase, partial [Pseudomonas aeruginosa]